MSEQEIDSCCELGVKDSCVTCEFIIAAMANGVIQPIKAKALKLLNC